jgi:hypothetical protein
MKDLKRIATRMAGLKNRHRFKTDKDIIKAIKKYAR